MKRCLNPECDPMFLYGNDKTVCPFCHGILVSSSDTDSHFSPADRIPSVHQTVENDIQFIKETFGCVEYHGRITEIEHHELFNSKILKLTNAIFRGEPYQLAHQTIEYSIRVESLDNNYEKTDISLFGNYLGKLQPGDEVVIKAKKRSNRKIAKSIFNCSTETYIKPGFQISPFVIRLAAVAFVILAYMIISGIIQMFQDGTVASLFSLFVPIAVIVWFLKSKLRKLFRFWR